MIRELLDNAYTITAQLNSDALPKANVNTSVPGVLRLVFIAIASLSIIFVAVGALKYVLSGGDPQGISKAKDTILYALVGLILAVSAFTIVSFVGRLL